MRKWQSRNAMIRYYQAEGFVVGEAKCCGCGFTWVANIHPDAICYKLDCPACHWKAPGITQSNNWFTEFQILNPS